MAKKKSKYPRQVDFTVDEVTELMGNGCSYDEEDREATITIDEYFVTITKVESAKGEFNYMTQVEKDYEPLEDTIAYSDFGVLIENLQEPYDDVRHFQFIPE